VATIFLHIGGLVAVGFDVSGNFLLTISHSGRGVFSTGDWSRVAREYEMAYPEGGVGIGIGPIAGQRIPVRELNSDHPVRVSSPDGAWILHCEGDGILVERRGRAGEIPPTPKPANN
jgi:hypothetical protein